MAADFRGPTGDIGAPQKNHSGMSSVEDAGICQLSGPSDPTGADAALISKGIELTRAGRFPAHRAQITGGEAGSSPWTVHISLHDDHVLCMALDGSRVDLRWIANHFRLARVVLTLLGCKGCLGVMAALRRVEELS